MTVYIDIAGGRLDLPKPSFEVHGSRGFAAWGVLCVVCDSLIPPSGRAFALPERCLLHGS